jgi:AcrR family transcriptional regulator
MRIRTRQKILDAAYMLISEKGYLGVNTREIAQQAGIAEVTLFRHFGSKERLFEEILSTYSFLPKLKQILPQVEELPLEEALITIGINFLKSLKERKSLVRIMLSEINVYPDKIRVIYKGLIDSLNETLALYFKGLQDKGIMNTSSIHITARAFLGMIFCYFQAEEILNTDEIKTEDIESIIKEFVTIFIWGTVNKSCDTFFPNK